MREIKNENIATADNADTETTENKGLGAWLSCDQPRLGAIGTLALLVIASLLTPLALDMYTPAIPHMVQYLNTDAAAVNLTLVGFFAFNAIGLLLFGTMGDKYGRKPVLLAGAGAYTLGSALCAIAPTIEFLIAMRVVQALGAGAVGAIGTAVVKDAFKPPIARRSCLSCRSCSSLVPCSPPSSDRCCCKSSTGAASSSR